MRSSRRTPSWHRVAAWRPLWLLALHAVVAACGRSGAGAGTADAARPSRPSPAGHSRSGGRSLDCHRHIDLQIVHSRRSANPQQLVKRRDLTRVGNAPCRCQPTHAATAAPTCAEAAGHESDLRIRQRRSSVIASDSQKPGGSTADVREFAEELLTVNGCHCNAWQPAGRPGRCRPTTSKNLNICTFSREPIQHRLAVRNVSAL
jgi:hypothetical protein